jgi:adenylate cyclase
VSAAAAVGEETGRWPRRRDAILDWLVEETRDQPYVDNLLAELCRRLVAAGVPLARMTAHVRTLHPQFMGARMLWRPGLEHAELNFVGHGITSDPVYLQSPVRLIYEGAAGLRRRLEDPTTPNDFPILAELRQAGLTDYVAMALPVTNRGRHAITWATDRPGGFSVEDLSRLDDLLPVLAMVFDIRVNRRITRNLLDTYVGAHAGQRILEGAITRGSGETIHAAIWNCDIRGFTQISETWPRDDVIRWLNDYFDVMSDPVEQHGGEILKFVGDGMLAIFPLADEDACRRAFGAATAAIAGMAELNARRHERDEVPLGFGIALHVGDVMYGNVGSRSRLDFTVIGPAVNVAARMQGLCKQLGRSLLLSGPFVGRCAQARGCVRPLGAYPLRGVGGELEVYGLESGG